MIPAAYNLWDAQEGERVRAPTRDQISQLADMSQIWAMLSYAEDQVIAIGTILEYYPDDDGKKGARVAAIIFWKQAVKNLKNRVNYLQAEARRLEKATT